MIILGVDPGSRVTGYGVIRVEKSKQHYITSGCLRVKGETLSERIEEIFAGLQKVVNECQPVQVAIEKVFMHRYPGSALTLGQARGAAVAAVTAAALPVAEYSARQIKQSVVGHGAAKKDQVQHMVRILLNVQDALAADAADALAVALCHANSSQSFNNMFLKQLPMRGRFRRGRMR